MPIYLALHVLFAKPRSRSWHTLGHQYRGAQPQLQTKGWQQTGKAVDSASRGRREEVHGRSRGREAQREAAARAHVVQKPFGRFPSDLAANEHVDAEFQLSEEAKQESRAAGSRRGKWLQHKLLWMTGRVTAARRKTCMCWSQELCPPRKCLCRTHAKACCRRWGRGDFGC